MMKPTPFEVRLAQLLDKNANADEYQNKNIEIALLGIDGGVRPDVEIDFTDFDNHYKMNKYLQNKVIKMSDLFCYSLRKGKIGKEDFDKFLDWIGSDYFNKTDQKIANLMFPSINNNDDENSTKNSTLFDYFYANYFKDMSNKDLNFFISKHIYSGSHDNKILELALKTTKWDSSNITDVLYEKLKDDNKAMNALAYKLNDNVSGMHRHHVLQRVERYLKVGGNLTDAVIDSGESLLASIKRESGIQNEDKNKGLLSSEIEYLEKTYLNGDILKQNALKNEALYITRLITTTHSETEYKNNKTWNKDTYEGIPIVFYLAANKGYMDKFGAKLGSTQKGVAALNIFDDQGLSIIPYIGLSNDSRGSSSSSFEEMMACLNRIRSSLSLNGLSLLFKENNNGFIMQRKLAKENLEKALKKADNILKKPKSSLKLYNESAIFDPRENTNLGAWSPLSTVLFGDQDSQHSFIKAYENKIKDYNLHYQLHNWKDTVALKIIHGVTQGSYEFATDECVAFNNDKWMELKDKMDLVFLEDRKDRGYHFTKDIVCLLLESSNVEIENLNQGILQLLLPTVIERIVKNSSSTKTDEVKNYFSSLNLDAKWMGTTKTCEECIKDAFEGIRFSKKIFNEYDDTIQDMGKKTINGIIDSLPDVSYYEGLLSLARTKQDILKLKFDDKNIDTSSANKKNGRKLSF